MTGRERVLLDSNILYYAARYEMSSFRTLWQMAEVELLISSYILAEVNRHLHRPEMRASLWQLVYGMHLVDDGDEIVLPDSVMLPKKDVPILRSAIAAEAEVLLTGDKKHFGGLFGKTVQGVRVESTFAFKLRYARYFPS